ncbi:MAG: hypothetical protein U0793_31575 [Gemmataceae bacterium]
MTWHSHDFEMDGNDSSEPPSLLRLEERPGPSGKKTARRRQKISLLWQVFGGSILSIVALVVLTAYSQLTSMVTDLRRDMNDVQVNGLKKEEFTTRLNAMWTGLKELQAANASLLSLNERAKVMDQQIARQAAGVEEQRKDLQSRIDDLTRRLNTLAERLAALEASQRVATR